MRRSLKRLSDESFDLLIIGAGVTGACIARDAALRGLSVAVIDKGDFSGATSANNSKLIHGGLRYLRNFELGLVREALRERRIWQRIAPHLVHPLPFLVPMFDAGLAARATLEIGLTLYDALSYDRGWLDDSFQRLPGHSWLSRREAAASEPVLDVPGLEGAFVYYDAQMYTPERLALECLIDADANGAAIANYVEAETLTMRGNAVGGCITRDVFSKDSFAINAKQTVVATGPWSDLFLGRALGKPPSHRLKRSKGIHVIVPARTRRYALTVAAEDTHFFVLPWHGHTLLGTTDTAFSGSPDDVGVDQSDIVGFFDFINRHMPSAALSLDEVEHAYAGLRPLVDTGVKETYQTSRRAEVVDHGREEGTAGLVSVIGGKWTSSRNLAEKTTDMVVRKLGRSVGPCSTAARRLPGGDIDSYVAFETDQKTVWPQLRDVTHLTRLYGTRLAQVMKLATDHAELAQPLGATGDIGAQVIYAVREEMALTVADVVMRRTGIGQLGRPSNSVLEEVGALMAVELGWSPSHQSSEVASLTRTAPLTR